MPKTVQAEQMDAVATALRPFFKERGFRAEKRTFNRRTSDGLTHVLQFQMGRFDPPGTNFIPVLRENMYGKFTVNVGVYVPEVFNLMFGCEKRSFIQEVDCCVRRRLGELGPHHQDLWWPAGADARIVDDLRVRCERDVLPFFAKFETRDATLKELRELIETSAPGGPPRIVCAVILANRGQLDDARMLLETQIREAAEPRHTEYVLGLATKLGLDVLHV
jgi:Domain of unknown function (DUF4304)